MVPAFVDQSWEESIQLQDSHGVQDIRYVPQRTAYPNKKIVHSSWVLQVPPAACLKRMTTGTLAEEVADLVSC